MRLLLRSLVTLTAGLILAGGREVRGADWIRAGGNTNRLVWGLPHGLQFAVAPAGFRPPEPRGLIRLGYPIATNGAADLVNFIAVEPVVAGHKGFSELEPSRLDGVRGKRFTPGHGESGTNPPPAEVPLGPAEADRWSRVSPDGRTLEVLVRVERFDNGAHVRVLLAQDERHPDELRLTVYAEPDSAPLEYCILTATMGNMARTRRLWLRDETVDSRTLYPGYQGPDFAPHMKYPLSRLWRDAAGDAWVAVTTDEADPGSVSPFPGSRLWRYGGHPVTQYWRRPGPQVPGALESVVNARFTYWMSKRPIPGGIAYENFELREPFSDGQTAVFGITRRTPAELGLPPR